MTSQLNFNIIDQNKRPVYAIRLYIVLLQPLAFCFQRSQNESTGSFILSQEEVPSNGFVQVQTFHNLRNVSSRPGKYKIDANLHLTCTSHQKSRRIYLHIWPTSYVENYQCQSYEAESIYLSGGNQQEGPAPWRVHADTVMLLPNQENIAVRAGPSHQLFILFLQMATNILCVELTLLVVRARHTQSLRRPSSLHQRAMFYLTCKMRSVCLSSSITIDVVFIVSAFRWHQCLCFFDFFNHRQRLQQSSGATVLPEGSSWKVRPGPPWLDSK